MAGMHESYQVWETFQGQVASAMGTTAWLFLVAGAFSCLGLCVLVDIEVNHPYLKRQVSWSLREKSVLVLGAGGVLFFAAGVIRSVVVGW